MPFVRLACRLRPRSLLCASVRLRITVRCGKSSKCWNTMPIRARSPGKSVLRSPTEMPSTTISPCSNGSRPLTHLMSVDLPDPEGPHTTTTSPLATSVEQPLSTWTAPYHLLKSRILIMAAPSADDGEAPPHHPHASECRRDYSNIDPRR